MKFSVMFPILAMAATCCAPARHAPPPDPIAEMRSKTVALITLDEDNDVSSVCSGVWVTSRDILTAAHCTHDAELGSEFTFATSGDFGDDGIRLRKSILWKKDDDTDLALLFDLSGIDHGVATVADKVLVGEPAYSIGHPMGLWYSYTTGFVSAVRTMAIDKNPHLLVQATTPTSPGNSGGGLFDSAGKLIGLAHVTIPRGQSLNLFIHPSYIQKFLTETK